MPQYNSFIKFFGFEESQTLGDLAKSYNDSFEGMKERFWHNYEHSINKKLFVQDQLIELKSVFFDSNDEVSILNFKEATGLIRWGFRNLLRSPGITLVVCRIHILDSPAFSQFKLAEEDCVFINSFDTETYQGRLINSLNIEEAFIEGLFYVIEGINNAMFYSFLLESLERLETDGFLKVESKDLLTHKQQIHLLDALGFFDLHSIQDIKTEPMGRLLSFLLNRNEKNCYDYAREKYNSNSSGVRSSKNVQKIKELLKDLNIPYPF